jgi:hypothetical protein
MQQLLWRQERSKQNKKLITPSLLNTSVQSKKRIVWKSNRITRRGWRRYCTSVGNEWCNDFRNCKIQAISKTTYDLWSRCK